MEQSDFDELLSAARQIAGVLRIAFREVADDEVELESMIRHYPVTALGLAAGAGAVAGWWFGRRRAPRQAQQPAPPTPPARSTGPLQYIEDLLPPGSIERVRSALPDPVRDEVSAAARTWVDTVLEPRLRQGLDNAATAFAETRFGAILKQAAEHLEQDVQLEDPEQPSTENARSSESSDRPRETG